MSSPLLVRLLLPKLQARGGVGAVRNQECQRALTQKQTLLGAAAHLSEVTVLPFSPSQSAVMPAAVNS